jgi:hypothetical protein
MNTYELQIRGLDREAFVNGRSKLLACPEVRDLVRAGGRDRFLVLYDGRWVQPNVWCLILANAGYPAQPVGDVHGTEAA